MSRFLKIFIFGLISLNFSFALIAEDKTAFDPSPEYIRLLIAQLGSANFADRENANKELLKLGYYARGEVEKSLGSKDPEVKTRLKDIWQKIKWIIFPGAGQDVNNFIAKLQAGEEQSSEQWDEITKKYGPEIILLFIYIKKQPDLSTHIKKGLLSLLNTCNPEEITAYIKKSPLKQNMIEILLSLNEGRLKISDSQKLQAVLIGLGLKEESVMAASSAWRIVDSSGLPVEIIAMFDDSDFAEKIFSKAFEQLNGAESSFTNDWKICFFAKIAKEIKRKEHIKGLINDLDYSIRDHSSIIYLSEILISMSLFKEVIDVLSGTHTTKSIYLRSVAYHNAGDTDNAKKFMDLLYTKLITKRDCYLVGEEMVKFKDPRAVKIWEKILKLGSYDSVYDSKARSHLADYYEKKGEYGEAADLLEKGLKNIANSVWDIDQVPSEFGNAIQDSLKIRITNLREQEKGGAEIWFNAVNAMNNEENEKAFEGFRKFIENNPKYAWAYFNLSVILESQRKYEEAIPYIEKAIECVDKDNNSVMMELILKKSFLLSMQKKYDKTIAELKKGVDLDPENSDIFSMLAMNTYYTKDYKKSAELFARTYAMDPEDLYSQLWIYISLRKINKDPNPEFANFAQNLKGNEWPIPIIKYYADSISLEQCLEATVDPDKNRENEKKCEAYYFIGELMLFNKKKKEAIEYFKKCIKCEIPDFREHLASQQRLEELK